jgi:hypothetical protein
MKRNLIFIALISTCLLYSCGKGGEAPPVQNNNTGTKGSTGTTGGDTTTQPIVDNVLVQGITVIYLNGVPAKVQVLGNAPVEIDLASSDQGESLELVNANLGTETISNSKNASSVVYSAVANSSNNKMASDDIAKAYATTVVYLKIPVDKSKYGVDEYDAYLNNDGSFQAGIVAISGNPTDISKGDMPKIVKQVKWIVTYIL